MARTRTQPRRVRSSVRGRPSTTGRSFGRSQPTTTSRGPGKKGLLMAVAPMVGGLVMKKMRDRKQQQRVSRPEDASRI